MASYATKNDVQARLAWTMDTTQQGICTNLLDDAAVMIDTVGASASTDIKKLVSIRMVMRALGDGNVSGVPMGATQGSQSALGYTQSWTISNGGSGELYLSKAEKLMLGANNNIGSYSPVQELAVSE